MKILANYLAFYWPAFILVQRKISKKFLFTGLVVRVVKSSIRLVFITRLDLMNGDKLA